MSLPDDLRAAAGGLDRRYKVPRQRTTTRGPVSVEMLLQAADRLETLDDENRRLHSALLAIINTKRDPVTIAREALGDE